MSAASFDLRESLAIASKRARHRARRVWSPGCAVLPLTTNSFRSFETARPGTLEFELEIRL